MRKSFALFFLVLMGTVSGFAESAVDKTLPGLKAFFRSGKETDTTTVPNFWLYVPPDQSPTPFLPSGKFTVVMSGFIMADMRSDFSFQAELDGALKLEINGETVLEATGTNSVSALSKPIRLNKGTNFITANFSSSGDRDAMLRLMWKPKDGFVQPIPSSALIHFRSLDEEMGKKLRLGRELFAEHRCAKCHLGVPKTGMAELEMDAPSLEEIGTRRQAAWMANWIADPKLLRATAHMPKLFSGEDGRKNAEAIALFLGSVKTVSSKTPTKEFTDNQKESGARLFENLHCVACHNDPSSSEIEAKKISLKNVRGKFVPGALVDFLKQPDAHYAWIRMPRFKLTEEQFEQLAAFLTANSEPDKASLAISGNDFIELGKKLLQTSGCLNCHSAKLENLFSTKTLAQISDWKAGCLAKKPDLKLKAPQFGFSVEERDALQTFCASDRISLSRQVPVEFVERQSRQLNCAECHGKIEGIPSYEILGGKLKPEWAAKFIGGKVAEKIRPWLDAQMPVFARRAQLLAEGLSMQHGLPPQTPAEKPIDLEMAEVGRKLISVPPLGFSCVSCHSVGSVGATQVFEAPGVNLAFSGERLQKSFFHRWVRSPSLVDSTSKMPTYFDEDGKSPLTDVYGGDGVKQIEAIWQYLRQGAKMPAPKTQ